MATPSFEVRYEIRINPLEIAISYYPILDIDEKLRRSLGSGLGIPIEDFPELQSIVAEMQSYIPQGDPVSFGSKKIQPTHQLIDFSRYATKTFATMTPDVDADVRETLGARYSITLLGKSTKKSFSKKVSDLSEVNQKNLDKIDAWVFNTIREHFIGNIPEEISDAFPELAKKRRIFMSLRGKYIPQGEHLHKKLKNYANGTLFDPYIYSLDMKPGLWLAQLQENIRDTNIFLPLLTDDYYEGPISILEHDQAIRQAETTSNMTIIAVLLEGKERDYWEKFIGGYSMKPLPMNIDDEDYNSKFENLVSFLLIPPHQPQPKTVEVTREIKSGDEVKENHDDTKRDLLRMFINEVSENFELLNLGYVQDHYGNRMHLRLFFRNAFDYALRSRVYSKFSSRLQTTISYYYGGIDRWNELVKRYEGEERSVELKKIYNAQSQVEIPFREATEDLLKLLMEEQ